MRLLKEPLVHFVVAGAVLFGGYSLINRSGQSPSPAEPIHIGAGEFRWIKETFSSQWRRAPTAEELSGLLAGFLKRPDDARTGLGVHAGKACDVDSAVEALQDWPWDMRHWTVRNSQRHDVAVKSVNMALELETLSFALANR